jgi:putative Holliday junction resolvase
MPVLSYEDFRNALPPSGALLGLDPGSKIIGVAATDPARRLAMPVESLKRTKFTADAQRIFELFDARTCAGLIIGLPRNMDGSEGPSAQSARAFARNLLKVRETPILFYDERLSTAAVTRQMIEGDASRAQRAAIVDQLAAAYVLQGVVDRLMNDAPEPEA